jgi:CDP-diacylglycerol--glycerol-3-phosphate 3-phosphatidyltransferase
MILTFVARPPARLLLRLGVTPNVVTILGTALVSLAALLTVPLGHLWLGALLIALITLTDGIDGQMARLTVPTKFGAFLDSTLDRVADGAINVAVVLWLVRRDASALWVGVALVALVSGQIIPYARARAEAVGLDGTGGLTGRADRIALTCGGLFLAGLGVPWALEVAVAVLALLGTVTVAQRLLHAWRSA